tara:strand:+ start:143 stop:256 length:114 start_codon:yes stop_codon:yes gene_type:complete
MDLGVRMPVYETPPVEVVVEAPPPPPVPVYPRKQDRN